MMCFAGLTPGYAEHVKDLSKSTKYLALGDSIAFGYTPLAQNPGDLKNYHGYPDIVSQGTDLKVANASCFGESTGHFLNLLAPDTGCQAWRAVFPLFADYSGTQMDYALAYLQASKNVQLVTIDIGANDLGVLLGACAGDATCFGNGLPGVLAAYGANMGTIFYRIRFEAGYTGPIVAVNTYARNYNGGAEVGPITLLNGVLATVAQTFGVQVADAFTAFGAASSQTGGSACAAGLLIVVSPGVCDIHPSAAGQALIAQTVLSLVPHE
jgi:lysophospholipase L1-like esterase